MRIYIENELVGSLTGTSKDIACAIVRFKEVIIHFHHRNVATVYEVGLGNRDSVILGECEDNLAYFFNTSILFGIGSESCINLNGLNKVVVDSEVQYILFGANVSSVAIEVEVTGGNNDAIFTLAAEGRDIVFAVAYGIDAKCDSSTIHGSIHVTGFTSTSYYKLPFALGILLIEVIATISVFGFSALYTFYVDSEIYALESLNNLTLFHAPSSSCRNNRSRGFHAEVDISLHCIFAKSFGNKCIGRHSYIVITGSGYRLGSVEAYLVSERFVNGGIANLNLTYGINHLYAE